MPKKKVSRLPILLSLVVAGLLALAACSATPTNTPVPPPPMPTATTPPPPPPSTATLTPTTTPVPPTSTPQPTATPTSTPPPTFTPTPESTEVMEFCEYVQGANVLTASAGGESVAGVVATGQCNNFYLDDSARDAAAILEVAADADIFFELDGAATAVYALDVHSWPTGRPSLGRFAPEEPLDRVIGFPLSVEASYPSFEYAMAQGPGDYRIVVNAAWPDGNQVVFFTFRVQVH